MRIGRIKRRPLIGDRTLTEELREVRVDFVVLSIKPSIELDTEGIRDVSPLDGKRSTDGGIALIL